MNGHFTRQLAPRQAVSLGDKEGSPNPPSGGGNPVTAVKITQFGNKSQNVEQIHVEITLHDGTKIGSNNLNLLDTSDGLLVGLVDNVSLEWDNDTRTLTSNAEQLRIGKQSSSVVIPGGTGGGGIPADTEVGAVGLPYDPIQNAMNFRGTIRSKTQGFLRTIDSSIPPDSFLPPAVHRSSFQHLPFAFSVSIPPNVNTRTILPLPGTTIPITKIKWIELRGTERTGTPGVFNAGDAMSELKLFAVQNTTAASKAKFPVFFLGDFLAMTSYWGNNGGRGLTGYKPNRTPFSYPTTTHISSLVPQGALPTSWSNQKSDTFYIYSRDGSRSAIANLVLQYPDQTGDDNFKDQLSVVIQRLSSAAITLDFNGIVIADGG